MKTACGSGIGIQNSSPSKVNPPAAGLQNHGGLFCWVSPCPIRAFYPGPCEGRKVVSLSVSLPSQGMSDYDCPQQNMSCGFKKLKWRSALTVSCKDVGTTTADFITIIRVFLRGKSMLPCPKTCSGGAQFLLEFQTVVLYTHETSGRSTCTACWLCEYCF